MIEGVKIGTNIKMVYSLDNSYIAVGKKNCYICVITKINDK